jgi:ribosomal protein S21
MSKKQKHFESIIPGSMTGVRVPKLPYDDGKRDLSFALRKWKKMIKDSKILIELKDRTEYIKPSFKKKEQRKRSAYLQRKQSENM